MLIHEPDKVETLFDHKDSLIDGHSMAFLWEL